MYKQTNENFTDKTETGKTDEINDKKNNWEHKRLANRINSC